MKRVYSLSALLVCVIVFTAGCSAKQDMSRAEAAVTQFHSKLNAGSYDQIYSDTDSAFKNATTQEKFTNLLGAIHRKLGSVQSANRQNFFLNYGTNGKMIRLNYATQYDNDKAAEEFVFRVSGNDVKLVGYHINSDLLVTQ